MSTPPTESDQSEALPEGTLGSWAERVGRQDGYAAASATAGVAGFLGAPVLGPILAIVLGRRAKARLTANPGLEGTGLARAGIALGWIGLTITLVVAMVALFTFCSVAGKVSKGFDSGPASSTTTPWS